MRKYYSSADVVNDDFLPVPMVLLTNPNFSLGEVVLYAFIKNRMKLSQMNTERFEDKRGIFVIYKQKDLAEMLHRDIKTIKRYFEALKKAGLILTVQEEAGRPAKIYLRNLYSLVSMGDKNVPHEGQKCPPYEGQKCPPNKEDIEKEDIKKEDYKSKRFTPPTLEEVKRYVSEKHLCYVNPEVFFNYYESNGWKVQGRTMQKWKAACSGWNAREAEKHHAAPSYGNGYGTMESGF